MKLLTVTWLGYYDKYIRAKLCYEFFQFLLNWWPSTCERSVSLRVMIGGVLGLRGSSGIFDDNSFFSRNRDKFMSPSVPASPAYDDVIRTLCSVGFTVLSPLLAFYCLGGDLLSLNFDSFSSKSISGLSRGLRTRIFAAELSISPCGLIVVSSITPTDARL